MLALSFLDSFQATFGGQPLVSFRTRKVQALLVYLAVEHSSAGCPREKLMTLLWPGMPEQSAQSNLRQVIYHLRKVIPPAQDHKSGSPIDFLLSDNQRVLINPAYPCQVDVTIFEDLLQQAWDHAHQAQSDCPECAQWLHQAVNLYKTDFLADFYLSDSNEFEEWAAITRQTLRGNVLDALEILTEDCIRQKDFRQARVYVNQQLHIDNLHENSYRQLMTIHALSGRQSEALAVYEACKRLFEAELGMAPTARTTLLYEKVQAGEITLPGFPSAGVRGYDLKEEIGSGYIGKVHRAIQTPIGREVAIKIIRTEYANQPEFIRRFEAEAHTVASLEHPHIVPLYDYWRQPDGAFLVMRLFRSGSLQSALQAGSWPPDRLADLVDQIASALYAAHQHGIIHRDIKPANILLDEVGYAYLSDFGIAIEQGKETEGYARMALSSSPEYISPEQILNEPITPQSDIYCLGLVLFEALAGMKPFDRASLAGLIKKQLEEPLPRLSALNPGLPAQLDAVIQRATAKDPHDRYPDTLELAHDFRRAARHEEVGVEHISSITHSASLDAVNPYKGLRPFGEEDADDFFGREALVQQLLARLSKSRFLAVVGPSGSGKSSVVGAGLIPALKAGALPGSHKWFIAQLTPGSHPFEAMEQALLKIAVNPPPSLVEPMLKDQYGLLRVIQRIMPQGDGRLLLVVDQFEELYTLTRDDELRDSFIDSLLAAIDERGSLVSVVVTIRADFYDRPLSYLPLGELLQEHTEVVLPLSLEELEQAIRGPASRAGVRLEDGLVAVIASDVNDQPGALPLLQYALTELYEARQDHTLTRAAYQAMDGISGALGRRAESLYQTLDEQDQAIAYQVFVRLVTLGEGMEDTRRRVLRSELESIGEKVGEQNALDHVLDCFARYRLLTLDHDPLTRGPTVEVAHEALLREWPRLQIWLDESREDIRIERQLAEAAAGWHTARQEEDYLLRGNRLEQYIAWMKGTNLALTDEERLFLYASIQAHEARLAAEAERAAHERKLENRSRRFLWSLVAVLAFATIAALILSNFAFGQRDLYRGESQARATAQAQVEQERLNAEEQAKIARSRELASLAQLKLSEDPELSMLLALEGLRTSRTAAAENALRASLQTSRLERTLYGFATSVGWLRISPDGKRLASAPGSPGEAVVWDLTSGQRLFTFPAEDIADQFDGEHLVTFNRDETLHRIIKTTWSLDTGEKIAQEEVPGVRLINGNEMFIFNPDLTRVIVGYPDGRVELWDAISGKQLHSWQEDASPVWRNFTFSPDGRLIVSVAQDSIRIWNTQSWEEILYPPGASTGQSTDTAAFSPDGRLLASSGENNTAVIWDVEDSIKTGKAQPLLTLRGHTGFIFAYAFSADGSRLATASNDGTVRIWSLSDGQQLFTLPGKDQFRAADIAFTSDGEHLATSDLIGDIRIWDLSPGALHEVSTQLVNGASFFDLDYSPDGRRFATVGLDGHLRVWSEPGEDLLLDIPAYDGQAYHVAFSPDGQRIATTGSDGRAIVWDAYTGIAQFSIQGHTEGYMYQFHNYQAIVYSPDGKRLATGGADGLVKLWDSAGGDEIVLQHPIRMTQSTSPDAVISLVFSPDGRYLAVTAAGSQQALVFDSYSGEQVLVAHKDNIEMWAVSFSPDGSRLAIANDEGAVIVIDFPASLAAGKPVELFTIYTSQVIIAKIDLSPDGHYLATVGEDPVVRIWEAATGAPLSELPGMSNIVVALQFSPDGKYIRAGGFDGSLRKYVVSTDDLIDLAYKRLTRWWRPDECSQYLQLMECPTPQKEITWVDEAISPAELLGTWQTENVLADAYLRFQQDGRLVMAQTLAGLDDAPLAETTFEVDRGTLSISPPYPGCPEEIGRYRLRLVREPGQPLRLILGNLTEFCFPRYIYLHGSYVQLEP